MTETERTYWKHKIEDAVHAAKAAVQEGYVPGAGAALARAAEELGEGHVLYEALMAPSRRIRDNAGGSIDVPESVIDPAKVTRIAFENACSAAGILITTGSGIAERRKTILDALERQISPEEDDFRDYAEHRTPGRVG
jgi:chaperonin GroEL